ncbi:MAG: hypothetical protein FJW30_06065 [Acidobacteria bacterium]|nr:hypothetical protein [Acidobacteriota bacterium]
MSRLKDAVLAVLIFALVFVLQGLSPITQSADSRWAVPLMLSLLERGDLNLDEYVELWTPETLYSIECAGPGGEVRKPAISGCPERFHAYSFYPVATPVLSIPLFLAIDRFIPLVPAVSPGTELLRQRVYLQAHRQMEILVASATVALTAVFLYALAGAGWQGFVWSLIFAFGTSLWSTASRAMWHHGMSILLLSAALWLLTRKNPRVFLAGILLGLAIWNRPLNILAPLCLALWLRRDSLWMLAGLATASIPFLAWNLSIYRMPVQPYFFLGSRFVWEVERFAGVLAGQLFSPGRGLLVYSPFLVVAAFGLWKLWKADRGLALALAMWAGGHAVAISLWGDWTGGIGYGPRYWLEVLPPLALLASRVWPLPKWVWPLIFVAIIIHARGSWDSRTQAWSQRWTAGQVSVWDWKGAPFLAGWT